jgi:F0F1-type ATP synthase alpha subunit
LIALNVKNTTSSSNPGAVIAVRGSVVDIQFEAHLPDIYTLLHAKEGKVAIEVLAQLDAHRVRGIALTDTQGLVRGNAVEDTGGPLKAPVGKGILSRMFDVFGKTPSTASQSRLMSNGALFIAPRRRWRSVPPNPRFSRQGSRSSMFWCRSSAAGKQACLAARAWERRYCSPK